MNSIENNKNLQHSKSLHKTNHIWYLSSETVSLKRPMKWNKTKLQL